MLKLRPKLKEEAIRFVLNLDALQYHCAVLVNFPARRTSLIIAAVNDNFHSQLCKR
jgi:hypothetical protein